MLVMAQPAVKQILHLVDGDADLGNLQLDPVAPGVGHRALRLVAARRILQRPQVSQQLRRDHLSRTPFGGQVCRHIERQDDDGSRRDGIPEQRRDDDQDHKAADGQRQVERNEEPVADMLCLEMFALQRRELDLLFDQPGCAAACLGLDGGRLLQRHGRRLRDRRFGKRGSFRSVGVVFSHQLPPELHGESSRSHGQRKRQGRFCALPGNARVPAPLLPGSREAQAGTDMGETLNMARISILAPSIGFAMMIACAGSASAQIIISPTCAPSVTGNTFMAELSYTSGTPDLVSINLAALPSPKRPHGGHGITHNVQLKPPPSGPSVWLEMDPSSPSCSYKLSDGSTARRSWTISAPKDSNASFHIKDTIGSEGDAYAFP